MSLNYEEKSNLKLNVDQQASNVQLYFHLRSLIALSELHVITTATAAVDGIFFYNLRLNSKVSTKPNTVVCSISVGCFCCCNCIVRLFDFTLWATALLLLLLFH